MLSGSARWSRPSARSRATFPALTRSACPSSPDVGGPLMIPDFTDTALSQLWSLDGRVAVVTGGGSGMGQATALRLAEAGAATVVADIDPAKARETVDLIAKRTPRARTVPLTVDVTDPALVRALGDATVELFGRIDIWVNTAWLSSSGGIADY